MYHVVGACDEFYKIRMCNHNIISDVILQTEWNVDVFGSSNILKIGHHCKNFDGWMQHFIKVNQLSMFNFLVLLFQNHTLGTGVKRRVGP